MGLTVFKGAKVRKADVTIAKNYLNQDEISNLNRIVTMYLDYVFRLCGGSGKTAHTNVYYFIMRKQKGAVLKTKT